MNRIFTTIVTRLNHLVIFVILCLTGAVLISNASASVGAQGVPTDPKADPQHGVCAGAKNLGFTETSVVNPDDAACDDDANNTNAEGINDLIATIINIFSVIVGIIAVIMIIWGGLKFITSGGDSGRVASARSTILYAVIGLIIVALAQIVVRFILDKATETVS